MNAEPLLNSVVAALAAVRLAAILIGNAAAAIQGAPVTTVDFDFMFRATPVNLGKLKKLAVRMDAVILRPYYPMSALYRVMNDDRGLQVDFMPTIHGVKSFNRLRSRAGKIKMGGHSLWIADLQLEDLSARARPRVSASSALPGHGADGLFDTPPPNAWRSAGWRSGGVEAPAVLDVDFQREREYGGLVIDWEPDGRARSFGVATSNDGVAWETVHGTRHADAALPGRRRRTGRRGGGCDRGALVCPGRMPHRGDRRAGARRLRPRLSTAGPAVLLVSHH